MKKKLLGLFLCFLSVLSLTGCQLIDRVPIEISSQQFKQAMKQYEFEIHNNTKNLNSQFVKENIIAIKNAKQIEYYQFKNEEDCQSSYDSTKNKLSYNQQLVQETQNKNCIKTVITTQEKYYTLVKIGKVMLFCTSNIDTKDDIDAIISNFNF